MGKFNKKNDTINELKKVLNNLRNNKKKCPYCGMLLIEGAKFCKNCGKKI